jgi:hypothetical protein
MRAYEYVHNDRHYAIRLNNVAFVEWNGGSASNVVVHFVGTNDKLSLIASDANAAHHLYDDLMAALHSAD